MICLKGYNQKLKRWTELIIPDNGTFFAKDWECIAKGSIKRYTEKLDVNRELLWEDDEIINEQNGVHMFIRYGEYEVYCPANESVMKSVGFYMESEDYPDMPLGETDEYARKVIKDMMD